MRFINAAKLPKAGVISQHHLFLTIKPVRLFCSSGKGLVNSMSEVSQGNRLYDERSISQARSFLEQSLTILPFYIKGDTAYNQQFESVVCRLARCYAWEGAVEKMKGLNSRILEAAGKQEVQLGPEVKELTDVVTIIGENSSSSPLHFEKYQQIKDNLTIALKRFEGKVDTIPKELIKSAKDIESDTSDLSPYIHGGLNSSIAFVLSSLLASPSLPTNPLYNKLCNTLLKTAEKSSQKNVPKALLLLSTNLLRTGQYLQAEGMLQYCLQRKRGNLKAALLNTNQEYVLMQLLLAATFAAVERAAESERIREEWKGKLDARLLLGQILIIDSI